MSKLNIKNLLSLVAFIIIILGAGSIIGTLTSIEIQTWFNDI